MFERFLLHDCHLHYGSILLNRSCCKGLGAPLETDQKIDCRSRFLVAARSLKRVLGKADGDLGDMALGRVRLDLYRNQGRIHQPPSIRYWVSEFPALLSVVE